MIKVQPNIKVEIVEPFLDNPNLNASTSECIGSHKPSRARTYNQHVDGVLLHNRGIANRREVQRTQTPGRNGMSLIVTVLNRWCYIVVERKLNAHICLNGLAR